METTSEGTNLRSINLLICLRISWLSKKGIFSLRFVAISLGVNNSVLIVLAAVIPVVLVFFGLRKKSVVPGKLQSVVESIFTFVKDEIALGVIGRGGEKFTPYLISIFLFILVGNLFEVAPLINFPVTSRMALPLFLSLITYFIFVFVGIKEEGFGYISHLVWPPGVPIALKPLVGVIELVSVLLVRPFSLAVRLFANLVAGHVMLSLLLASAYFFIVQPGGSRRDNEVIEAADEYGMTMAFSGIRLFHH